MRFFPALLVVFGFISTSAQSGETKETVAGWTLEERRNPAEARDYSISLSKKVGAVELVAKRSAIKGRDASLFLGECVHVSFGSDISMLSVAEQIQSIREAAASAYDSNRAECKLPPMNAALLRGFDEAYRAMDTKFRAGRPPAPSSDRSQKSGGWAVEDKKDESDASEPGHRLITLNKTEGGLKLTYTMDVNLFFDSMFFTRNKFVVQYSDCRREQNLSSLDKEGAAEAAGRKAEVAASLRELQKDCQLPAATASAMLSDFSPALMMASGWARKYLADRAALIKVADEYENQLASVEGAIAAADAAEMAAEDAAEAAECATDAATGQPDPICGMMAVSDTCYMDPATGATHGTNCPEQVRPAAGKKRKR